jgi:hypothetical protein
MCSATAACRCGLWPRWPSRRGRCRAGLVEGGRGALAQGAASAQRPRALPRCRLAEPPPPSSSSTAPLPLRR